jgi:outer membrane protein assembly factor BamD (BamD/ComL family)
MRRIRSCVLWLSVALVAGVCAAPPAGTPDTGGAMGNLPESGKEAAPKARVKRGTPWLLHPQKASAAAQNQYARGLYDQGRLRKAAKAYLALVYAWPDSAEAADAQLAYAQILEKRGDYTKAFDEYQYLIDHYAGHFDYLFIVERQFMIANYMMTARRGKVLFLPGFAAPERALPMLEKILENAPSWEKAAHAQFNIGLIHEQSDRDLELAVAAYELVQNRYGSSEFAAPAAFRAGQCLYRLYLKHPNDEGACNAARMALIQFIRAYPEDDSAPAARAGLRDLDARQATLALDRARYYDRILKRPAAALIAYTDCAQRFPATDQARQARARMEELKKATDK